MKPRYRSIVDVHIIIVRDGMVVLTRRADTGFGDGLLHLPSGHLEAGENVAGAAIREAREEIGIEIAEDDVTLLHTMHHRDHPRQPRIGFFFRAGSWHGEPRNCEPEKCSELRWEPLDRIPDDTLPYSATALDRIAKGETFSVYGWD